MPELAAESSFSRRPSRPPPWLCPRAHPPRRCTRRRRAVITTPRPPSPTLTPTPTPTAAAGPTPLVGVSCTDLTSLALVRELLESKDAAPAGYVNSGTRQQDINFANVALRQLGGIGCYWEGGPIGDGGPEAQLAIEVLPNASAAFAAETSTLLSTDDVHNALVKTEPKLGSASYSDCVTAATGNGICTFDIQSGSYWLHITEQPAAFDGQTTYTSTVQTSFLNAATAAVTSLGAPGSAWTVPADSAKIPTTCATLLSTTDVDSALGPKAAAGVTEFGAYDAFDTAIFQATNLGGCSWTGPYLDSQLTYVFADALPGSGWAWSATVPPPGGFAGPLTAISGLGDGAYGTCNKDGDFCLVYVETDDSWFDVEFDSVHATLTNTETLAKDILAEAS